MKRFLIHTFFTSLAIALPLYFYLSLANGFTDAFYLRFTSSSQNSLVIGTSRSAQGLDPDVLNKRLKRSDVYNYSFTQTHSPFGPIYLNSITKKLNPQAKDAVYIVSVEPWALGEFNEFPNDSSKFRENNTLLDKTSMVSLNPNIPYLLKNYSNQFFELYRSTKANHFMELHPNGWLQVKVNLSEDSILARTKRKTKDYRDNKASTYHFSELREKYLKRTIELLQQHGRVYLVRLPVGEGIFEIEEELVPDFTQRMRNLASQFHVSYFDFTTRNRDYIYVDGNHISTKSVPVISEQVADSILFYDARPAAQR